MKKPKVNLKDIVDDRDMTICFGSYELRRLIRLEDRDLAAFKDKLTRKVLAAWKEIRTEILDELVSEALSYQEALADERKRRLEKERKQRQIINEGVVALILKKKLTVTAAYMKSIKDPELKQKIVEATCLSRI